MIHGHTRITLRNPISGNILKDIESENTFQPAVLQNFVHGLGEDLHGIQSYNWQDLVGGIFLFEDEINVLGNNAYMPASNTMIGNGAVGISNSSDPVELGSYNTNESSASASAITQVYDFSTSQANGSIGCVCLTSKVGGEIGYGNTSGRRTDTSFSAGQTATLEGSVNSVVVGNILYSFSLTGNSLTIQKTKKSLTYGSVFHGYSSTVVKDLSSIKPSGATLDSGISVFALNNGKIRIYSPISSNIAAGSNVYFFDYTPSDDSIVLGYFANSAGKVIRGDVVALSFTPDEYCVTYDTDRYLQVFNVSTGIHEMDYLTEKLLAPDRNGNYDLPLSDGLLLGLGSRSGFMINYIKGTVKPINIRGTVDYGIFLKNYPSLDAISFTDWGSAPVLIKNPLYLATINNLDSPVVKTAAQTMKVIYTLTEA